MNSRAVDVVIPCFNAERFVGAAIESVFAQRREGTRIIFIDDGSTDGSAAIAGAFGPRVECWSQSNAGIAAARNAGIARAQAPYLAFVDADDLWTDGSLAARFAALDRSPGAECVFGALQQFLSPELDPAAAARIDFEPAPTVARFVGTMLIRRDAFLRAGPFDTALKVGEMVDWVSRAEFAGVSIVTLDAVVMRRRIHGNNTVMRQKMNQADYLRALKAAIDRRRWGGDEAATTADVRVAR